MKRWSQSDPCPCCRKALQIQRLGCPDCGIEVRGPIEVSEFTLLDAEDLHLLRIFLRSEGKIREMESPLGLSYPTLRTRISDLNLKLQRLQGELARSLETPDTPTPKDLLERLARGEISFEESLALLKKTPTS